MADFRNLARQFGAMVTKHNEVVDAVKTVNTEHQETRKVVAQLIGSHNLFVGMSFGRRLRWLFLGDVK